MKRLQIAFSINICGLFMFQISIVITVDKNPARPLTIESLKKEKSMSNGMRLRQQ